MVAIPPRIELCPGLEIARLVTGLWQVADMERDGSTLHPDVGADALSSYAQAGFDCFDMADHYGSAEEITGRLFERISAGSLPGPRPRAFTKWCPVPGAMTREVVRAGVGRSLRRMRTERIDLLQLHWWSWEHPAYLDALAELGRMRDEGSILALGLTNSDSDHLRLLLRHGAPIATNQVSFSLLDRRAAGPLSALCGPGGPKLLAYGVLAGGFLTDRWVGRPEPGPLDVPDWSKSKYKRFIDVVGGWPALQSVLAAAAAIARRHGVSVANVATRWVLDQPAVAAVIIGARLGESEHRTDNLAAFSFTLDAEDHERLEAAFRRTTPVPGDCGDEYRRPPYLTASGDLSHHLSSLPQVFAPRPAPGRPDRQLVDSGSRWEPIAGYSRAVRVGNVVAVSGTTATHGAGDVVAPDDAAAQTTWILDKIAASLAAVGATMEDVVRTRIYLVDADDWEGVSRAHGRFFGDIRPANTLLEVSRLVGSGYRVEIEADAIVSGAHGRS